MTMSPGFAELIRDLLSPLGPVATRRMFGGGGVYCDGVMFGLVSDDTLFLKADAKTKAAFEDEGCGPFVYDGKGKPIAMSYWRMPERLLDEPEAMVEWARIALGVARAGKSGSAGGRKRKATKSTRARR